MSLRGGLCRSNLLFYGNCWSKEDCHAATPALAGGAREEQERRLTMTKIYEMYGREISYKKIASVSLLFTSYHLHAHES
jgi:hypothetical protein